MEKNGDAKHQESEPPTPHSIIKMSLRDCTSSMEDPDGTLASVAQCIEQLQQSSSSLDEKEHSLRQCLDSSTHVKMLLVLLDLTLRQFQFLSLFSYQDHLE